MRREIEVVLYSKPGCHLCEEMKSEIARANCSDLYLLKEINIEADPVLWEQYTHDIPVLKIDGVEVFRHHLQAEHFREKIIAVERTSHPREP